LRCRLFFLNLLSSWHFQRTFLIYPKLTPPIIEGKGRFESASSVFYFSFLECSRFELPPFPLFLVSLKNYAPSKILCLVWEKSLSTSHPFVFSSLRFVALSAQLGFPPFLSFSFLDHWQAPSGDYYFSLFGFFSETFFSQFPSCCRSQSFSIFSIIFRRPCSLPLRATGGIFFPFFPSGRHLRGHFFWPNLFFRSSLPPFLSFLHTFSPVWLFFFVMQTLSIFPHLTVISAISR